MRIGVKFERSGMCKYISHLDLQRVFSRAIRRSKLPVVYSQGFNPHIILSFAQALAVGLETTGDYMEFSLTEDLEDISGRLNMPPDIKISKVGVLEEKGKKLMASVEAAEYDIHYTNPKTATALREFMAKDEYVLKNKKGNELDARKLVFDAEIYDDHAVMMLSLSSSAALSPFVLMQEFAEEDGFSVLRKDLYTKDGEKLVPLSSLFIKEL